MANAPSSSGSAPSALYLWGGRVLTALPALMLLGSGGSKIAQVAPVVENFKKFGFPEGVVLPLGLVEVLCAVLFLVPRTAALGAILVTGYLGGAVCTHLRVGENFVPPIIIGMMAWGGLYLRDERVRALLPLRRQ